MFDIGDKVVYPMHGAGVIEAIEEKEVLGMKRTYFIMKIPVGDMKVMIPREKVANIGLRQVIGKEGVKEVMSILRGHQDETDTNWNQRYRANMEKIKSGDVFQVTEVVRNLMIRDQDKGLSTGEKKMLESAKQILVSELVLAEDMNEQQVLDTLDSALMKTS